VLLLLHRDYLIAQYKSNVQTAGWLMAARRPSFVVMLFVCTEIK
jgi:hypothetical protein